jgi:MoaA/NifB/PqqE/SkfB family radical SAM enzyme
MSRSTFASLLPSMAHARRIDLSGLAEPLMNRHIAEMLTQARAASPHARIAIATNATLLTPELSERLIAGGLDELVFSLDGVDPLQVDAVRRGGSLDTVTANIRALRDLKAQAGSSTPVVSAALVLQRGNLHELSDVVRLAAELGCEGVSVNGLEPYGAQLVDAAIWTDPSAVLELERTLADAARVAHALGIELRLPAMSAQPGLCPQAARPIVLASGEVVPCSVLAYERPSFVTIGADGRPVRAEGTVDPVSFGNIADGGLEAVWASPAYRAFRKAVAAGHFPAACDACLMKRGVVCAAPPLTAPESIATIPTR